MSAATATILALVVITFAIKAAGPVLLGGRELPPRLMGIITLLAPALLAALVVVETFSTEKELVVDARAAGVGAAAVSLVLRAPILVAVPLAAVVTGAVRALS